MQNMIKLHNDCLLANGKRGIKAAQEQTPKVDYYKDHIHETSMVSKTVRCFHIFKKEVADDFDTHAFNN